MFEKYWDGENWLSVYKNDNTIKYFFNNEFHRNDGPADISYYDNGDIKFEFYLRNGVIHRIDGPAAIFHNSDGFIENEWHVFNGKEFNSKFLPFEMPIDTDEKKLYMNLKYGE